MATIPDTLRQRARALIARVADPPPSPPVRPPSHVKAREYLQPTAAWPLVYVTDISGWSEDATTSQVSFALKHGATYTNEAANFQCKLPFADGDLFDKRGAYIVVIVPATDQEQVIRILRAARQ